MKFYKLLLLTSVDAKGRSTFVSANSCSSIREILEESSIMMVITSDLTEDCKTIIFPENINEYFTDPKSNNAD